jgi:hypothetical protein
MDIITGLSAASSAINIAKQLKEFEKKFNEAEFKLRISELLLSLADVKESLADARQTILDKDEEIRALKAAKAASMRTVSYRGYNFGIDAEGKSIGRPFCPVCEKKGIQIQLVRATSRHDICPSCQAPYSDHPYKLPSSVVIPHE